MYICVECNEEYEESPHVACRCGCLEFYCQDDLFDADELGIDPEVDAERFYRA